MVLSSFTRRRKPSKVSSVTSQFLSREQVLAPQQSLATYSTWSCYSTAVPFMIPIPLTSEAFCIPSQLTRSPIRCRTISPYAGSTSRAARPRHHSMYFQTIEFLHAQSHKMAPGRETGLGSSKALPFPGESIASSSPCMPCALPAIKVGLHAAAAHYGSCGCYITVYQCPCL